MDMYTLLYLKWVTSKDVLCSMRNSAQRYVAVWTGGEFGGEWIHVYVWLSPFTVHLKLSQHCYSALSACILSHVRLFGTLWTVAHQTPLSMGFSRQEYGSGLPCPLPRDLPNPGTEPKSPVLQADLYQLSQ